MKYELVSSNRNIQLIEPQCQACTYVYCSGKELPCHNCFNGPAPLWINFKPGSKLDQYYILNAALEPER